MMNIWIVHRNELADAEDVRILTIVHQLDGLGLLHLLIELGCRSLSLMFGIYPRILDNRKLRPNVLLYNLFMLVFELDHPGHS